MGLTQVNTDGVKDDAVTIAKQAAGTDGQIITYDASGNPKAIGPGTDGQVLTSAGAGAEPAFEDAVSEGTQVKSTGESGGTKFLREDGDGTCSWQTLPSSGAALTGSTNNTITTVTSANAIQGEANLTFDGTTLDVAGDALVKSTAFDPDNGAFDAANYPLVVQNPEDVTGDSTGIGLAVTTAADKVGAAIHHVREGGGSQGDMRFLVSSDGNSITERLRIHSGGNVEVKDGDLVIGTAGHGIDFSAQTVTSVTGTTPSQTTEVLDHYEQGSWTPNPDTGNLDGGGGRYVRVGNVVYLNGYVKVSDISSSNTVLIAGIPYSVGSQGDAGTGWNGSIRGYNLSSNIGDSTEPDNCCIDGSDKLQFGAVTNNGGGWAMLNHNEITNSNHAINFTIWYVTDA